MEFTCRLCCWCVKCFISRANRREDSAEKGNKAVCWLTQGPVRTSGRLEPVLTDRTGQREKPTMPSSDLIQFDSGPVLLSEPLTGITATDCQTNFNSVQEAEKSSCLRYRTEKNQTTFPLLDAAAADTDYFHCQLFIKC